MPHITPRVSRPARWGGSRGQGEGCEVPPGRNVELQGRLCGDPPNQPLCFAQEEAEPQRSRSAGPRPRPAVIVEPGVEPYGAHLPRARFRAAQPSDCEWKPLCGSLRGSCVPRRWMSQ